MAEFYFETSFYRGPQEKNFSCRFSNKYIFIDLFTFQDKILNLLVINSVIIKNRQYYGLVDRNMSSECKNVCSKFVSIHIFKINVNIVKDHQKH